MTNDRCKTSNIEKVDNALFIRCQPANLSMTGPHGSTSCWVPHYLKDEFKKIVEDFPGDHCEAFIVVACGEEDKIFSVEDSIFFKGGDLLLIVEPVTKQ